MQRDKRTADVATERAAVAYGTCAAVLAIPIVGKGARVVAQARLRSALLAGKPWISGTGENEIAALRQRRLNLQRDLDARSILAPR